MRVLPGALLVLIYLAALGWGSICFFVSSKSGSAIHEIEGLICALIVTVCTSAAYLGAGQKR